VKKHVLILGAGFGGLELATRLSETMSDAVRVTLLDRNDSWYFGYSKLDVTLGRRSADEVRLCYSDVVKEAVELTAERTTKTRRGCSRANWAGSAISAVLCASSARGGRAMWGTVRMPAAKGAAALPAAAASAC
jgi:hypothetical protein